jgi:hypothetical protein
LKGNQDFKSAVKPARRYPPPEGRLPGLSETLQTPLSASLRAAAPVPKTAVCGTDFYARISAMKSGNAPQVPLGGFWNSQLLAGFERGPDCLRRHLIDVLAADTSCKDQREHD